GSKRREGLVHLGLGRRHLGLDLLGGLLSLGDVRFGGGDSGFGCLDCGRHVGGNLLSGSIFFGGGLGGSVCVGDELGGDLGLRGGVFGRGGGVGRDFVSLSFQFRQPL